MTNSDLIHEIESLQKTATQELMGLNNNNDLEAWRIKYLGRSGKVTNVLRSVGELDGDMRRTVGAAGNQLKSTLENELINKRKLIAEESPSSLVGESIDTSLPSRSVIHGRYHPTTIVLREICHIFQDMGFRTVEGPEVEWDRYNFEMLNIPQHHPARDMWDTLWIDTAQDGEPSLSKLLRTHTSPMQARIMENTEPPIRVIVPGKCYRYEATDPTHESQFYQVEGLVVDRGVNFANLKFTLFEFAKRLFGTDRKIRFRCDYFPFVEPGVDMSIDCFKCQGTEENCRICKGSGWIEIMGAGMVHPTVLKNVGYDPGEYTGFAFGLGPERIAMLKYGIDDIRLFYNNDIRFLRQF